MSIAKTVRAIYANMILGWKMEGNWAPPWVYLFIALLAPASGVLMLVFMYLVIFGTGGDTNFLAFLMTGSSVFIFVRFILQGAGWAVIEDREHYHILRYIYLAPVSFVAQLFGRVMSKFLIAIVGATFTFVAARWLMKIPFNPEGVDVLVVIYAFAGGVTGLLGLGLILASTMLLVDRMGWVWAEGVAGLLFLMSGAVIPLPVLPAPLAAVGKILPITYWAELWRFSLFGSSTALSLPGASAESMLLNLWIISLIWLTLAVVCYKAADILARKNGRIEAETFY